MTLHWNTSPRGGYWAKTMLGDEIVIHHPDTREWILQARGDHLGTHSTLRAAKRAAEEYVESLRPVEPVATVGRWSINDAGHLWCDGEYIGHVYEDGRERNARQDGHPRSFYAQGVAVESGTNRRFIGMGSSTAVTMTKQAHDALALPKPGMSKAEHLKRVEDAARQLIFSNDQERVYRWGVLEDTLRSES